MKIGIKKLVERGRRGGNVWPVPTSHLFNLFHPLKNLKFELTKTFGILLILVRVKTTNDSIPDRVMQTGGSVNYYILYFSDQGLKTT